MGERISTIAKLSDGLLVLPGGYGTIEEAGIYIGGKANKLFDKPIVIYNYNGFYDKLIEFFDNLLLKQFSKIRLQDIAEIITSEGEIIGYFKNYKSISLPDKFI